MGAPEPLRHLEKKETPKPAPKPDTSVPETLANVFDVLAWIGKNDEVMNVGTDAAGFFLTAYAQYLKSTATTTTGKLLDAGGAGAMDIAMGTVPFLPVADAIVGAIFKHFGVEGISISDTEATAIRAHMTLLEGLVTWDAAGMEDFHTRSINGEYGPIFQKASEFGEWAKPVTKVMVWPVVEIMRPMDIEGLMAQHRVARESEVQAPEVAMPPSSEQTSMKVTGVAYETIPPLPEPPVPEPPRERNSCGAPRRAR